MISKLGSRQGQNEECRNLHVSYFCMISWNVDSWLTGKKASPRWLKAKYLLDFVGGSCMKCIFSLKGIKMLEHRRRVWPPEGRHCVQWLQPKILRKESMPIKMQWDNNWKNKTVKRHKISYTDRNIILFSV